MHLHGIHEVYDIPLARSLAFSAGKRRFIRIQTSTSIFWISTGALPTVLLQISPCWAGEGVLKRKEAHGAFPGLNLWISMSSYHITPWEGGGKGLWG